MPQTEIEKQNSVNPFLENLIDKSISITCRDQNLIAVLKPLNENSLPDVEGIAELFTEWRENAKEYFKTGFEADSERTENWIRDHVIGNAHKILYKIFVDQNLIGHFGLTTITSESAELDNAIRGVEGGHSDLFKYTEFILLELAFEHLKVDYVYGNLFTNNFLAMALHKKFGFRVIDRHPLKLVTDKDSWEYVVCEPDEATERFEFAHIRLYREDFIKSMGKQIQWEFT